MILLHFGLVSFRFHYGRGRPPTFMILGFSDVSIIFVFGATRTPELIQENKTSDSGHILGNLNVKDIRNLFVGEDGRWHILKIRFKTSWESWIRDQSPPTNMKCISVIRDQYLPQAHLMFFASLTLWNQEAKKVRNQETKKLWNYETKKPINQVFLIFRLRESPPPLTIPTPTPAPAPSWGTPGNLGDTSGQRFWWSTVPTEILPQIPKVSVNSTQVFITKYLYYHETGNHETFALRHPEIRPWCFRPVIIIGFRILCFEILPF